MAGLGGGGGRVAGVAGLAVAALLSLGCQRDDLRTSQRLLSRETGLAFERAYRAQHKMTTGVFDEEILAAVRSRCHKLEVNPRGELPWHWRCFIAFRARDGASGASVYAVSVDPRGCFTATSPTHPRLAWERVLRRRSPSPLARFHSCP